MKNTLLLIALGLAFTAARAQDSAPPSVRSTVITSERATEFGKAHLSADKSKLYFVKTYAFTLSPRRASQDVWASDWKGVESIGAATVVKEFSDFNNNAVVGVSADGNRTYLLGTYSKKARLWPGLSVSAKTENGWSKPEKVKVKGLTILSQWFDFYVTPDELALFISKGSSQFGQSDLFVSQKDADGNWGKPQALDVLNTDLSSEISPFFSPEKNTLYFASNRAGGVGGFDVYSSERGELWEQWSEPKLLSQPVNSAGFDAYFSTYKGVGSFYVSNNGDSLSQLYFLSEAPKSEESPTVAAAGELGIQYQNESGVFLYDDLPREGVVVVVRDAYGNELDRTITDKHGAYQFSRLPKEESYTIAYLDREAEFDPSRASLGEITELKEYKEYSGYFEYDKLPKGGVQVVIVDANGNEMDRTITEGDGSFKFKKLPADGIYTVLYLDAQGVLDPSLANLNEKAAPENLVIPLEPSKTAPAGEVAAAPAKLAPVKPNTPMANPPKEAGPAGDQLLVVQFDFNTIYPNLKFQRMIDRAVLTNTSRTIQLTGYTDNVGSDAANASVSRKRAEAIKDYLVRYGYPAQLINVDWKGAANPVADNANDEGRAQNRRVELRW